MGMTPNAQAQKMLAAFAGVGVRTFNLVLADINQKKVEYYGQRSLSALRQTTWRVLRDAEAHQRNVIVRPRTDRATLVQLDDLNFQQIGKVADFAFLAVETSPGNNQVWIALPFDVAEDIPRRLRKGVGADQNASGAVRLAGSLNVKPKFAPSFPDLTPVGSPTSQGELGNCEGPPISGPGPRRVFRALSI
jgi:hypothetical protein